MKHLKYIRWAAIVAFVLGALFVGMTIRVTFLEGNYYQTFVISISAISAVLTILFSERLMKKKEAQK